MGWLKTSKIFCYRHWQLTRKKGKRGGNILFHSTTSTCSRTSRNLFATLHMRWLSHIFNRNTCYYQTATRWDLPPYLITLLDDLILGFYYSKLTRKARGFQLGSAITLVLQVNQLTKCASHHPASSLLINVMLIFILTYTHIYSVENFKKYFFKILIYLLQSFPSIVFY